MVTTKTARTLALFLLVVLAGLSGTAQGDDEVRPELADAVYERFQRSRLAAEIPAIERLPLLDRVATNRALRVASLAHADRLTIADPVADEVKAAGLARYRQVAVHLDMQKGFENPPAAFERNWVRHPSWKKALDPRYEAAGIGVAKAADGWLILVVVLVDPLTVPTDLESLELRVAMMINRERAERGLTELAYSQRVAAVARGHSLDMVENDYFAHASRSGAKVGDRMTAAGERYHGIAENLYRVRGSEDAAEAAVAAWMSSPGHRKNILHPDYRFTGIGIAVDDEGAVYFTQVFLTP